MADATEDTLHLPSHTKPNPTTTSDSESDDEGSEQGALDYRLLASLAGGSSLPKRGMKDFEPHPTNAQSSALQASRDAMTDAISHVRIHSVKQHVRGFYDPETGMTLVPKPKGTAFSKIGKSIRGPGTSLYPEEALWALESGRLDVWWKAQDTDPSILDDGEEQEEAENIEDPKKQGTAYPDAPGIPMSLQAAYAAYIGGPGDLTPEKYTVYANLKRSGFAVQRANGFSEVKAVRTPQSMDSLSSKPDAPRSISSILISLLAPSPKQNLSTGPVIPPTWYRSYPEIYRRLRIVPTLYPSQRMSSTPDAWDESQYESTRTPFTTTYNIHKATSTFRKTQPGEPDFRVCVVSARDTSLPSLAELDGLLNEQPLAPPPGSSITSTPQYQQNADTDNKSGTDRGGGRGRGRGGAGGVYARLKHGYRNVLLAVVDEGLISYIRLSEAGFAEEDVYDLTFGGRGGKGGGGGRGRGRGRGGRGGGERGRGRGRGA